MKGNNYSLKEEENFYDDVGIVDISGIIGERLVKEGRGEDIDLYDCCTLKVSSESHSSQLDQNTPQRRCVASRFYLAEQWRIREEVGTLFLA